MSEFKLVRFNPGHIIEIYDEPSNEHMKSWYHSGAPLHIDGFTLLRDGKVMAAGGLKEMWTGRAMAWMVFSERSFECFISVVRAIKKILKESEFRRIEMCVPVHFELGHRRAKLLGFKLECELARKYLPEGDDCKLYALIKGDS